MDNPEPSGSPKQEPAEVANKKERKSLWQSFKALKTETKVTLIGALIGACALVVAPFISGAFNVAIAYITTGAKPTPPPLLSPPPTATSSSSPIATPSPTPEVPQPKRATVYRNISGHLFIQAFYDPPQLRRGETLSLQASTRQSFDDIPALLPPSEIEFVPQGSTEGRLQYDPGSQPVWYRFLIIDAQRKPWYGNPAIAE